MRILIVSLVAFSLIASLAAGTENQTQPLDTLKIKAEVDILFTAGDSLNNIWQLDTAIVVYEEALIEAQKIDYRKLEGIILNKIGIIQSYRGRYNEALANWERAITLLRELGEKEGEAEILCNIGKISLYRGNIYRALDHYQRGLDICREIGDRKGEALALCRIGSALTSLSEYTNALEKCGQSVNLYRELDHHRGEAHTLYVLGGIYRYLDDDVNAKEYFERGLELSREVGDRARENAIMRCLGNIYGSNRDYKEAFTILRQSLITSQELKFRLEEAKCLYSIGVVYYNLAYILSEVVAVAGEDSLDRYWEIKLSEIDSLHVGPGDYRKALEYSYHALEVFQELNCPINQASVLDLIGFIYLHQEKYDEGIQVYEKALSIVEELNTKDLIKNLYWHLGWCYGCQEKIAESIEYYKKSLEIVEQIRGMVDDENYKSDLVDFAEFVYEWTVLGLLAIEEEEDAYNLMERYRARSFLDLLASSEVIVGKSKHIEYLRNEEEFREIEFELEKQIEIASDDTIQVASLRGKMEQEWESVNAIREEKKRSEPELVSMVTVNPLTLSEIQQLLDPETTLIEYFVSVRKESHIWVITHDRTQVVKVEVDEKTLEEKVKDFRDAIMNDGIIEARSRELYDYLIAPIQDRITTNKLIIIPQNVLHYLPFQALQNEKGEYLIELYNIAYLPSASVLKYLGPKKRPKGENLLAFGNPSTDREGYDPIPFAEKEASDIIEFYEESLLYIGEDATEDEFRELAPDYDILHLACHSELNSAYPLFSGLLLAPGEEHDGELDVHELFTMDLNAYLVVLSACQTGLGHLTTGDELVGLSRAFIYAGTPSVVSSLWVVKDESTAYLMIQFHKNLRKYDKAEALRRAQLKTKKKYKSPYHWASFVLIGSPD